MRFEHLCIVVKSCLTCELEYIPPSPQLPPFPLLEYYFLAVGTADAEIEVLLSAENEVIQRPLYRTQSENVPWVEFMYRVVTRMPGDIYRRRLSLVSVLPCSCDIFR